MAHVKIRRLPATLGAVALAIGLAAGPGATAASAQATSNIYNSHSSRCLGINSSRDAGIWNCTDAGNADQAWYWKGTYITGPAGIVYGMIENRKGQCLGVAGGSTANGARIVGWTCLPSHHDQYWDNDCVYDSVSGQGCVLANLNTPVNGLSVGGKVIGVAGGSTANGAAAVLWTDTLETGVGNFHPDQNWYFAP
jgi:Ricin-type beta-trefoil lectin domain-like